MVHWSLKAISVLIFRWCTQEEEHYWLFLRNCFANITPYIRKCRWSTLLRPIHFTTALTYQELQQGEHGCSAPMHTINALIFISILNKINCQIRAVARTVILCLLKYTTPQIQFTSWPNTKTKNPSNIDFQILVFLFKLFSVNFIYQNVGVLFRPNI